MYCWSVDYLAVVERIFSLALHVGSCGLSFVAIAIVGHLLSAEDTVDVKQ